MIRPRPFARSLLAALVLGAVPAAASARTVDLGYFEAASTAPDDIVTAEAARAFAADAFGKLDAHIFDPAYKAELRRRQAADLDAALAGRTEWSRGEVEGLLEERLGALSVSHLRVINPVEGRGMFAGFEAPKSSEAAGSAVSAEMRGDIGILRIGSFIVPQITRTALEEARARLKDARVILIDLRGNGGGFPSPISYAIESVIGPDRVISRDRTRAGASRAAPFTMRGFVPDGENAYAAGDIALMERHGDVEWRTRAEAAKDPRPHYLLVDRECGSACDVFAAAVKEHGAGVLLGARTYGAVMGGRAVPLAWPGYALLVPAEASFSPLGRVYEGVGVEPDVGIAACASDRDACLAAALDHIRGAG